MKVLKGRLTPRDIRRESLAGLTTSFAMVPETVGFALLMGVNPLVGLYASFILSLIHI